MAITLEQVQAKVNSKPKSPIKPHKKRRAQYYFLPRRQRDALSHCNKDMALQLLQSGDWQNFAKFYALIADYYECNNGVINDEWKAILKLPLSLVRALEKLA